MLLAFVGLKMFSIIIVSDDAATLYGSAFDRALILIMLILVFSSGVDVLNRLNRISMQDHLVAV